MARAARTLDRLAIIDDQGRRTKVQPSDVTGRRERWKPLVRWLCIAVFVVLPWLEVGGHPAVLFDVPERKAYLLGHIFGPGDLPFLFFILMSIAWVLVVVTALAGRIWCGWACPQTVTLEAVFRRIERVIEGNGHVRMAFDLAPLTASNAAKKALKWTLWLVASFIIAHVFLSYFVSLPRVFTMVLDDPRQNWPAFVVAAFVTGVTYFNFAWFREQVCLIICPYGRLQSALHDADSFVVGYDARRGEPRGMVKEHAGGDCVDCGRCVDVCPTGIDIRNGLQMECIACGACADACDAVMIKVHKPVGLVRRDSENGFAGATRRLLRPRLIGYAVAGAALSIAATSFLLMSQPLVARAMRLPGPPFVLTDEGATVQNTVMIHLESRSSEALFVTAVAVARDLAVTVQLPQPTRHLAPQERGDLLLIVRVPRSAYRPGQRVRVSVGDAAGAFAVDVDVAVLGPTSDR